LSLFDVWHQWRPVKFVERSLGEDGKTMDFFEPAMKHRGQVEALDGAHAIAVAKQLGLTRAPIVRRVNG
jgi:hypothetical protein